MPLIAIFDHEIHLKNDQMPPNSHIYPLSGTELGLLHDSLTTCLARGSSDHLNCQVVHQSSL